MYLCVTVFLRTNKSRRRSILRAVRNLQGLTSQKSASLQPTSLAPAYSRLPLVLMPDARSDGAAEAAQRGGGECHPGGRGGAGGDEGARGGAGRAGGEGGVARARRRHGAVHAGEDGEEGGKVEGVGRHGDAHGAAARRRVRERLRRRRDVAPQSARAHAAHRAVDGARGAGRLHAARRWATRGERVEWSRRGREERGAGRRAAMPCD